MGDEGKPAVFQDLTAADQALLDQLTQAGDDLALPRHTLLFFYQPKIGGRASFDVIAGSATEHGLTISRLDDEALILQGELYVHAAALKPLIDWATDAAANANAEFDGWECAIIAPKH